MIIQYLYGSIWDGIQSIRMPHTIYGWHTYINVWRCNNRMAMSFRFVWPYNTIVYRTMYCVHHAKYNVYHTNALYGPYKLKYGLLYFLGTPQCGHACPHAPDWTSHTKQYGRHCVMYGIQYSMYDHTVYSMQCFMNYTWTTSLCQGTCYFVPVKLCGTHTIVRHTIQCVCHTIH
jgi:hypothetical protein